MTSSYAAKARQGETAYKKATSWLFYRILQFLSDVEIPRDVGDFRLIDRTVLEAVKQCREQDRFMRGLIAWTGFGAWRWNMTGRNARRRNQVQHAQAPVALARCGGGLLNSAVAPGDRRGVHGDGR